jgi:lysozyme family protein
VTIEDMIEQTIGREGRYSDNRDDPGGATMWGITAVVARRHGYAGDMRDLPRETAVAIYRQEYAIDPGFSAVAEIDGPVGFELFDTGVNMGPARPALWFQEWLNAFNNQARLYPDIVEDGRIGQNTLATFRRYLATRGADASKVMVAALNCDQGERYKELARARSTNETFVYGWLRQRVTA